jgi:hypothetical protein
MIQDHQHLSYEEVSALVDGELVSRDAHDLEQHLASCAGRWSAQLSLPIRWPSEKLLGFECDGLAATK